MIDINKSLQALTDLAGALKPFTRVTEPIADLEEAIRVIAESKDKFESLRKQKADLLAEIGLSKEELKDAQRKQLGVAHSLEEAKKGAAKIKAELEASTKQQIRQSEAEVEKAKSHLEASFKKAKEAHDEELDRLDAEIAKKTKERDSLAHDINLLKETASKLARRE